MTITENTKSLLAALPPGVKLLAATKTQAAEAVMEAIAAGVYATGENSVQELLTKNALGAYAGAPLHFIGHLQKNKARQIVGVCDLIESVDSIGLMSQINAVAGEKGIKQEILLEINVGGEASKSGFAPDALEQVMDSLSDFPNILLKGLMTIPPISASPGGNRCYFAIMYKLFIDIMGKKYDNSSISELSMGMSGDFADAAAEGATLVRVGTGIFGKR